MIYDHKNSWQYAPDAWKKFVKQGRNGIDALKAPRIFKVIESIINYRVMWKEINTRSYKSTLQR